MPATFRLTGNYPNPFNPATQISYSLQQAGMIELIVTDMLGKKVSTVYAGRQQAGLHTTRWTAPAETPSGVYFYTLRTSHGSATRPMILMK